MNTPERDNLDEFLRRSLEEYGDTPPDALWDRIEAEVPPMPVAAPTVTPRPMMVARRWWLTGIAAGLLLGVIVAQHMYYQQQLRLAGAVNAGAEATVMTVEPAGVPSANNASTLPTDAGAMPPKVADQPTTTAPGHTTASGAPPVVDNTPHPQRTSIAPTTFLKTKTNPINPTSPTTFLPAKTNPTSPANNPTSPIIANGNVENNTPQTVMPDPVHPVTGIAPVEEASAAVPVPTVAAQPTDLQDVALLPFRQPILTAPNPAPVFTPVPVKVFKPVERWVVGSYAQALLTNVVAPDRPKPPSGPFPQPPKFTEVDLKTGRGWGIGLTLGRDINRHWRIQTGLQYSSWQEDAVQRTEFRLFDGRGRGPIRGNGNHDDYEFDYALRSIGGEASVTLRVAPTDASIPRKPNDPVSLTIESTRRLAALSIPLSVQYRLGQGAWHPTLRAGLVTHIRTQDDVSITRSGTDEANFRLVDRASAPGRHNPTGRVALNWQVGAGIEYQLRPGLALSIEPVITGNFEPQRTAVPGLPLPSPQRTYFAFNLGILKTI